MNSISKFSKVNIDPSKSLLKGEDEQFCKAVEKDYLGAFQFFECEIEFFQNNREENRYLNFDGAIESSIKRIEKLSYEYIQDVVIHFSGKYKIDIGYGDVQNEIFPQKDWRDREDDSELPVFDRTKKYKVELNTILSRIQDKLGGLSLEDKSENEMKEKFYKEFAKPWNRNWRNNIIEPVVELNKNRVIFERGICLEAAYKAGFMRISSGEEKDLQVLFQTLSFFETGNAQVLGCFNLRTWFDYDSEFLLSDIEYNLEKLSSIRFYKNRKMVLKFKSNEIAAEFFKELCKNGELIGEA